MFEGEYRSRPQVSLRGASKLVLIVTILYIMPPVRGCLFFFVGRRKGSATEKDNFREGKERGKTAVNQTRNVNVHV